MELMTRMRGFDGFNTQPPEGGCKHTRKFKRFTDSFNTQPPEGGCIAIGARAVLSSRFQHTAARRRLLTIYDINDEFIAVSTHSRPKAAAGKTCTNG